MTTRLHKLAILGLLLVCSKSGAQTPRPQQPRTPNRADSVVIYAPGTSSCGAWLDAREAAKSNKNDVRHLQFEAFVFGFASSYNWYVGDARSPKGVLGETDAYAQWAYLGQVLPEEPHARFRCRHERPPRSSQGASALRSVDVQGASGLVGPKGIDIVRIL
jgi:hypothetical protein